METTATRIREARASKGWTQADLARRLGLSDDFGPMQISHWENGVKRPGLDNLVKLSVQLGVTTDFLACVPDRRRAKHASTESDG